MLIVFIGPPGAGKGTQSKLLTDHFGIPHLSTGAMLRAAIQEDSPLGRQVAPIMAVGKLVSDDLIFGVVERRLEEADCANGCLFDGFPRTIAQAELLERLFSDTNRRLDAVLELRVPTEELTRRLTHRAQEDADPRDDDKPEAIPERLATYQSETAPLLEFYQRRNLLCTVDGIGSPEEVFNRILNGLKAVKPS